MSGALFGVLKKDDNFHWKSCLIFGMIATSGIFYLAQKEGTYFEKVDEFQVGLSTFGFVFAGYFTGLGAKLQNGCTSGHGVCGLPRFSKRSFVAVCVFFGSALGTANIKHYGFPDYKSDMGQLFDSDKDTANDIETSVVLGLSALVCVVSIIYYKNKISDCFVGLTVGVIFALGLIISGMVKRHIVVDFLTFTEDWNPALAFVLGCAVLPNILTFWYVQNKAKKPIMGEKFCIPNNKTIDLKLIIGGIFFGVGWGIAGMCPGPIICNLPTFFTESLFFCFPALVLGLFSPSIWEYVVKKFFNKNQNSKNNSELNKKQQQQNEKNVKYDDQKSSKQSSENGSYKNSKVIPDLEVKLKQNQEQNVEQIDNALA
ncbi:hypothetical protein PPERSA_12848 [Pseudocohnilembus persalinus]|uniref:Sulphur transport domain-containing protein n=1 Tax=Pseudocohnilembus persalinus TaxID=266149 RepID=A0A0V0QV25_PSEPJ|nr:hypothetical protein PPERSA_12848 [Pseudocohnilembus persalinus]|eukprot:KRX06159.1 hypothetical protein PPERSA_12848 [Pseudocohnilembus persalinus]